MEILYRPRPLVGTQLLSPSLRRSNCPSISDLDRGPADVVEVQSPRARTKLDSLRAPTKQPSRFDYFCKSGTGFGFGMGLSKLILFCQYGRSKGGSCIKPVWGARSAVLLLQD